MIHDVVAFGSVSCTGAGFSETTYDVVIDPIWIWAHEHDGRKKSQSADVIKFGKLLCVT